MTMTRRSAAGLASLMLLGVAVAASACGSEDVGDAAKSGTGTSTGVGAAAAGGGAGVDTSGTRVSPSATGSVVAPGGTDTAAKTKTRRP